MRRDPNLLPPLPLPLPEVLQIDADTIHPRRIRGAGEGGVGCPEGEEEGVGGMGEHMTGEDRDRDLAVWMVTLLLS